MNEGERYRDPEHPRAEILRAGARKKQKTAKRGSRMRQIDRAEKYPCDANPINGQQPCEPACDGSRPCRKGMLFHVSHIRKDVAPPAPRAMQNERHAMQSPPNHERPRATVPEAAEPPRDHDVAGNEPGSPAISSQRNVKIIAQPARETDVPPMPEVRNVRREIREAEIDRQLIAEQARRRDCHVGVTGKVAIDLDC